MQKHKYAVIGMGLTLILASCSQPEGQVTPNATGVEIPDVARNVATSYTCPTGTGPAAAAALLKGSALDRGNVISHISAQTDLPETEQDMLYTSKSLLNSYYFGYGISEAGLQNLHLTTYNNFKKVFPKALSSYYIYDYGTQTDNLMNDYIDAVNDEHTYYMNAAQYDNYVKSSTNQTVPTPAFGINTYTVPDGNGVLILNVRGEGTAFKAGIRRGDVLLSIDGQALTRTVAATKNADGTIDDSAQTAIYSKILAAAAAKQTSVDVVIRHGNVQRTVQMAGAILQGTQYPWGEVRTDAAGQKYYYLRIPTFSGNGIGSKVHALVAEANAQAVSGIVVDLRNNGGGLLREYLGAVAAFVPDKASQAVTFVDASQSIFKYNNGQVMYNYSCNDPESTLTINAPSQWKGKVAVLLNSGSASASEMFSQNIKLGGLATLIGEKTYGVGNTSTFIFELPAARGLSVTAGRVSVDGQATTQYVNPDINVPDNKVTLAATGIDDALQAAFTTLR